MITTDKKTILALLAATMLTGAVTSCSGDEGPDGNNVNDHRLPITLSYSVAGEALMRSTTDTHITTQGSNQVFTAGQEIDLFIDEALTPGTTATYQGEVRYLKSTAPDGAGAVGKGNFETYSDVGRSSEVTLYWPASGNGLYFYAYYPKGAMTGPVKSTTTTPQTFTVSASQGTATASMPYDLMFGEPNGRPIGTATSNPVPRPTDNQRAAAAVNLNFKHCLSKVVVTIQGDGYGIAVDGTDANDPTKNQLTGALVTLGNNDICLQADVVPNSGVATAKTSGTKGTVTLKSDAAGNTSLTNYCILPPGQTLTGKTINVKLTDSGVKSFTVPQYNSSDVVLEAGKEYVYTVTVGLYEVSVTATVQEWDPMVGDDSAVLKY